MLGGGRPCRGLVVSHCQWVKDFGDPPCLVWGGSPLPEWWGGMLWSWLRMPNPGVTRDGGHAMGGGVVVSVTGEEEDWGGGCPGFFVVSPPHASRAGAMPVFSGD